MQQSKVSKTSRSYNSQMPPAPHPSSKLDTMPALYELEVALRKD